MMPKTACLFVTLAACNLTLTPVTERQLQSLQVETRPSRVIWLVDMSGSMAAPADPASPNCPAGCGPTNPCPTTCATRKSQLVAGLGTFTANLPANTTHDVVIYPSDSQCGAPNAFTANATAAQVASLVEARAAIGGTPTAAALDYASALPPRAVDTFVVLVTDGWPNCNSANPNHQCQGVNASCRCTTSSCTTNLCALGCLDDLGTVSASHALASHGMRLLVLGLGFEFTTEAVAPFAAMEIGLPRTCTSAQDCLSGCDAGVCGERLFRAMKAVEYEAPASRLVAAVGRAGRCSWWLPHEVAAGDLHVKVSGEVSTEWNLATVGGGQRVEFTGLTCDGLVAQPSLVPEILWLPGSN